ncbi:MAG TPA: helix-turn-helix domain-containing protein [Candidatus Absconditabacterales bacterium]|nr:helix-turn-helix domain-containing protein [Candidatus Absconditabacterales bacterium]
MKHPGELLIEEIRSRDLTQKEFSLMLGKSVSELNELIKGKRNITIQWDLLLSQVLDSPEKYWIHKQIDYDYFLAKKENEKLLSKTKLEDSIQTEEIPGEEKDDLMLTGAIEELQSTSEDFVEIEEAPATQEKVSSVQAQEGVSQDQEEVSVENSKNKIEMANIFRDF